jgi:hypothetical protein
MVGHEAKYTYVPHIRQISRHRIQFELNQTRLELVQYIVILLYTDMCITLSAHAPSSPPHPLRIVPNKEEIQQKQGGKHRYLPSHLLIKYPIYADPFQSDPEQPCLPQTKHDKNPVHTPSPPPPPRLLLIRIILLLIRHLLGPILANRDLNALARKALAQRRRLDHTGELLGRVHHERV